VQFLGIDVRDGLEPARAFVDRYKLEYPSLFDRAGSSLRAFDGAIPVSAVPSTVVLDRAGRVAAANVGKIDARTLRRLIADVLVEPRGQGGTPPTAGVGGS
jgi:peroxiredoxin